MASSWITDPFYATGMQTIRGSQVTVTARICPNQYIELSVAFSPANLKNHSSVQVHLTKGKSKVKCASTRKVEFHSDGRVIGHGNVGGNVSFYKKYFEIAPADAVQISIS